MSYVQLLYITRDRFSNISNPRTPQTLRNSNSSKSRENASSNEFEHNT